MFFWKDILKNYLVLGIGLRPKTPKLSLSSRNLVNTYILYNLIHSLRVIPSFFWKDILKNYLVLGIGLRPISPRLSLSSRNLVMSVFIIF
jgi:hypothetical protein